MSPQVRCLQQLATPRFLDCCRQILSALQFLLYLTRPLLCAVGRRGPRMPHRTTTCYSRSNYCCFRALRQKETIKRGKPTRAVRGTLLSALAAAPNAARRKATALMTNWRPTHANVARSLRSQVGVDRGYLPFVRNSFHLSPIHGPASKRRQKGCSAASNDAPKESRDQGKETHAS